MEISDSGEDINETTDSSADTPRIQGMTEQLRVEPEVERRIEMPLAVPSPAGAQENKQTQRPLWLKRTGLGLLGIGYGVGAVLLGRWWERKVVNDRDANR